MAKLERYGETPKLPVQTCGGKVNEGHGKSSPRMGNLDTSSKCLDITNHCDDIEKRGRCFIKRGQKSKDV